VGQTFPTPLHILKEESMNGPDILSSARHHLASAITAHAAPAAAPLTISPWIAMSLLQKAIRRGRLEFAQHAAATLLLIAA
jgi:hypothetical protein